LIRISDQLVRGLDHRDRNDCAFGSSSWVSGSGLNNGPFPGIELPKEVIVGGTFVVARASWYLETVRLLELMNLPEDRETQYQQKYISGISFVRLPGHWCLHRREKHHVLRAAWRETRSDVPGHPDATIIRAELKSYKLDETANLC